MTKAMKIKLIVTIVMLVTSIALIGTATWAWYTLSANEDLTMELHANGFVVLAFDTSVSLTPEDGKLVPAVEAPDAIANNATYNVRELSDSITEVAKPVTYKVALKVYLRETVTIGEDTSVVPKDLLIGLSAVVNTEDGHRYDIPQESLYQMFGYDMKMVIGKMPTDGVINATLDDEAYTENVMSSPSSANGVYNGLTGDCVAYIMLKVWLAEPQGLMSPLLQNADVKINISVAAR